MRRRLLGLGSVIVATCALAALGSHELEARHTVGDQARARWDRRIAPAPPPEPPRLCAEGETPTDRDPCVGAHGRLEFREHPRAARSRAR